MFLGAFLSSTTAPFLAAAAALGSFFGSSLPPGFPAGG